MAGADEVTDFPWQHSFPPFYTLQIHEETKKKQLEVWCSIVLDYCQKRGLTTLDIREISGSPLFNNATIQRRLSDEAMQVIFDELQSRGNLEWIDKSRRRCYIYWRSPEEWGTLIYAWIKGNGMTNTVCTFYELTEGEDATDQPFYGLDRDILIKSLQTLEKDKRAELFVDDEGVKFF